MTAAAKPLPPTPAKKHWLFGSAYYFATDAIPYLIETCPQFSGIFSLTSRFEKVMVFRQFTHIKERDGLFLLLTKARCPMPKTRLHQGE